MAYRDKHHCNGYQCNGQDLTAEERGNQNAAKTPDEPKDCCECPCSGCSFSIGFARGYNKGLVAAKTPVAAKEPKQ